MSNSDSTSNPPLRKHQQAGLDLISDCTPTSVPLDVTGISASNSPQAMKSVIEAHIKKHIVEAGHAKEGEVIVIIDDKTDRVVMKSTGERTLDEILKLAFPEQYLEAEVAKKMQLNAANGPGLREPIGPQMIREQDIRKAKKSIRDQIKVQHPETNRDARRRATRKLKLV